MKKMKKLLALCLALAMAFTLTACGGNGGDSGDTPDAGSTPAPGSSDADFGQQVQVAQGAATQDGRIDVGTWWKIYYDSSDSSVEDDPGYSGMEKSHLIWDRLKYVEQQYGMSLHFNNLTFEGNRESFNTSIIAGAPDMDIYMMDMSQNATISAHFSGLGLDLRTILPADHDIFTNQERVTFIDFGDGKAILFRPVDDASVVDQVFCLAFNLQMLEANNLERPDVLWERGEWTWAKFEEYMKVLTQDTNGDGEIDQYGFAGWYGDFIPELLMSNGTYIANGPTENISSPEVGQVLDLVSNMYSVWNVANPYDQTEGAENWTLQRYAYRDGNIAFWPIVTWIASQNADYNHDANPDVTMLDFDTIWVRWPVGPNGNKDTNAGSVATKGNVYTLPVNVAEPELVFNYIEDYWNWYEGDLALRAAEADDWAYRVTGRNDEIRDHNYSVMVDAGSRRTVEFFEGASPDGFYDNFGGLVAGTVTPAQLQETLKNSYQARLTIMFGN
jgi:predicted small lipoprotein YifL